MSSDGNATIKTLKLGNATISTSNWKVSGNQLTIYKAYLNTLANGNYTINIVMSAGNNLSTSLEVKTTETPPASEG